MPETSDVWKIGLYRKGIGGATCLECEKTLPEEAFIKTTDGSTKLLIRHVSSHPEYEAKLEKIKGGGAVATLDKFMQSTSSGSITKLDKRVINFIVSTSQAFNVVEHQSFKALLSLTDRAELKGRQHYSDHVLPRVYKIVRDKYVQKLQLLDAISFTCDIWSGPTESFISLTASGIDPDWKRQKFILCVQPFPGSHTAVAIEGQVRSMLESWNIPDEKCHVFLRDAGANIKKALENSGFRHADCGAHKMNLVVAGALKDSDQIKQLLEKCRSVVGHFSHSNLAYERLQEEQEREGLPIHRLVQDVATRWNSSYYMIERLIEQKQALRLYLTRHGKQKLELTEEEWDLIRQLVLLLSPFEQATRQLCQEDSSLAVQLPIGRMLLAGVREFSSEAVALEEVCTELRMLLFSKFSVEANRDYALATFLDPRFKDRCVDDKERFQADVRRWCREEGQEVPEQPTSPSPSPAPKKSKTDSFFGDDTEFCIDDDEEVHVSAGAMDEEVSAYLKLKCIPLKQDPLEFWKTQAVALPKLAKLAKRYLSAPATSYASEQLFSTARGIYDYTRSRLDPKNAEMLMFLNRALPEIDYSY